MTKNSKKLIQAAIMVLIVMSAHRVMADEVTGAAAPTGPTDNVIWVMYRQVLSNPASVLHCLIMCIAAWLIDETTWIDSKYIPHITIIFGAATFWLYAGSATVAKCYPYPWVVLASNGAISGLFAYGGHKQIIARLLKFARTRGNDEQLQQQKQVQPQT